MSGERLTEALQAVWDMGDEFDSNHTRFVAGQVAEKFGVTLRYHNDFSEPPRNRNEEQLAASEAARLAAEQERDRLREALRDTPWNPTNEEPNPAAEVHVEEFRAAVIERAGWRNATPDEWDAARSFLDTATEEKGD